MFFQTSFFTELYKPTPPPTRRPEIPENIPELMTRRPPQKNGKHTYYGYPRQRVELNSLGEINSDNTLNGNGLLSGEIIQHVLMQTSCEFDGILSDMFLCFYNLQSCLLRSCVQLSFPFQVGGLFNLSWIRPFVWGRSMLPHTLGSCVRWIDKFVLIWFNLGKIRPNYQSLHVMILANCTRIVHYKLGI